MRETFRRLASPFPNLSIDFSPLFAYITPLPTSTLQPTQRKFMVKLIALYKKPDDVTEFNKHYSEIHTPLVRKLPGLRNFEVSKVTGSAIGETPWYLLCEMYFDSKDVLDEALASPGGRAAAKDLMSFAEKYVTLMYAEVSLNEEIRSFGD
jgi:uncharacterized protein (TIGR02118 family)